MKTLTKTLAVIGIGLCLFSCKKNDDNTQFAASAINVTNAVTDGSTIALSTNGYNVISTNNTVGPNASNWFPLVAGNIKINLGVPAKAATATTAASPFVTYFNQDLAVDAKTTYSLFLTGNSPAEIDHVLIKENYTNTYADSVCGVRIINLSTGSSPISVNLQGSANGSEVPTLAYKAYSIFKQYPAKAVNSAYTFEFRDAATGTLLTTFNLPTPYFHNVTLVLDGPPGAQGVVQDNDFQ